MYERRGENKIEKLKEKIERERNGKNTDAEKLILNTVHVSESSKQNISRAID